MVSIKEGFIQEWGGGGQTLIIAVAEDGSETELMRAYTGYEEFSHSVHVEWYLKARLREADGNYIIEIKHFNERSGYAVPSEINWGDAIRYISKDKGKSWEKY